jgi:hypothetical protein
MTRFMAASVLLTLARESIIFQELTAFKIATYCSGPKYFVPE